MDPDLPHKSYALFRRVKRVKRSDIVLIDHPEFGVMVRKVSAISVNGRVGLRGTARSSNSARRLGNVDPHIVKGKLMLKMRWGRFLPLSPDASAPDYDEVSPAE